MKGFLVVFLLKIIIFPLSVNGERDKRKRGRMVFIHGGEKVWGLLSTPCSMMRCGVTDN
jgi:hypothetical protein